MLLLLRFIKTGRYPIRFGGQTGTAEGVRTWIPGGEPMLPERLARVGYECHIVGVRACDSSLII